jgi:biopolymer transport protein ExbD
MRKTAQSTIKPFTEINLTPLIDLSFLLLVTFIITMPVITEENAIPLKLPRGKAEKLPDKRHTIAMDKNGNIYLDGNRLGIPQLEERISAIAVADPQSPVLVRADESLKYAQVVQVLRMLHENKLTRVALVTSQNNEPAR